MKEKYITPEMEIVEFEEEACVTMSGGNENGNTAETGLELFDAGENWE